MFESHRKGIQLQAPDEELIHFLIERLHQHFGRTAHSVPKLIERIADDGAKDLPQASGEAHQIQLLLDVCTALSNPRTVFTELGVDQHQVANRAPVGEEPQVAAIPARPQDVRAGRARRAARFPML